ncbi:MULTISPECIES: fibronectin type III domain-containing protein [unclassified Cohnella]|uniref:fibronectin type III domain-containing protein n=1 Tax=unclassified Cohnella TaxID=2636738 RepID=UPI001304210C|nr:MULTISPECIES: fibronectin type III domain-containing protein [unclassified Cohnella]
MRWIKWLCMLLIVSIAVPAPLSNWQKTDASRLGGSIILKLDASYYKVEEGKTTLMTVTARGVGGNTDVTGQADYQVSDAQIATVANGVITGKKAGLTTVTVQYDGLTEVAVIQVDKPDTGKIVLDSSKYVLRIGQKQPFTVMLHRNGVKTDVTADAAFAISNPLVASVEPDGELKAHKFGLTLLTVTYDGLKARALISAKNSSDTKRPVAPSGLSAAVGDSQIALSWHANTESDLAGYLLYVYEDGDDAWHVYEDAGRATERILNGLTNDTTYRFALSAYDINGNESSLSATVSATPESPRDTVAPEAPAGLVAVAGTHEVGLSWTANEEPDLGGYKIYQSVDQGNTWSETADAGNTTSYTVTGLTNGDAYWFAVSAYDLSGNESDRSDYAEATPNAAEDTVPPAVPGGLGAVSGNGEIALFWTANIEEDLDGYIVYRSTDGGATWDGGTEIGPAASYTVTGLTPGHTYTFAVTAIDASGNESDKSAAISAVPSTMTVPALPDNGIAPFIDTIDFLYTGDEPIQTGVAADVMKPERVAVLRGIVTDEDGQPLPGVQVTILNRPEFGQTLTRIDGTFDMAVNGGGILTVDYEREGYMPLQRKVLAPWKEYGWLPDIAMKPYDTQVTTIQMDEPTEYQVARGSVVTDEAGSRQATILFAPGTTATMTMPDGTTQPLDSLNVRATEYTVGDRGPAAMPGELPTFVGYTYAVELSVDEAVVAGATEVRFNQPTYLYVDNFLEFPVGGAVPIGYYDRKQGVWVPSENGRIVQVVEVSNGMAQLDVDGDNVADSGTKLTALGITDAELQRLAEMYTEGQSFWRSPINHFTPWDCNWPYGPPDDAEAPPTDNDKDNRNNKEGREDPCKKKGSIIGCENQSLGQSIEIPGTSLTMYYSSDRTPGYRSRSTLEIPVTSDTMPGSLLGIQLEIVVQGKRIFVPLSPTPNQVYTFEWDGKDGYGRSLYGRYSADVSITYIYPAQFYASPTEFNSSFGRIGTGTKIGRSSQDGRNLTLTTSYRTDIESPLNPYEEQGIAGWSLNAHHFFDKEGRTVFTGFGETKLPSDDATTAAWFSGDNFGTGTGDGGPAPEANYYIVGDVVPHPDGSLLIVETGTNRVRKIGTDGIITTFAGNKQQASGTNGDGGPAADARINSLRSVAIGPDGAVYIAEAYAIRRVSPDGIITTIAGGGTYNSNQRYVDDIPALGASIEVRDVEIGPDGTIYFLDNYLEVVTMRYRPYIRKIDPDGMLTTIAGRGNSKDDNILISNKYLVVQDIAIAPDGTLYVLHEDQLESTSPKYLRSFVLKVGQDGIARRIAGSLTAPAQRVDLLNGSYRFGQADVDGPATDAFFRAFRLALAPDGSIYMSDTYFNRILRIDKNGYLTTRAGNPYADCNMIDVFPEKSPLASTANIGCPQYVAVGLDGTLYYSPSLNASVYYWHINAISPYQPGDQASWGASSGSFRVPSEDGLQLYEFDLESGRHVRTRDALTGVIAHTFHYDNKGRLISLRDTFNNEIVIERNNAGTPVAIVAPGGQRTELSVNANGELTTVTMPGGRAYSMTYDDHGLMQSFRGPNGMTTTYTYDASGLLSGGQSPVYGTMTITRQVSDNKLTVTMTRGEQATSSYSIESLDNGDMRRETIGSGGVTTVAIIKKDGSGETHYPDGTIVTTVPGPDPRWGMRAPLLASLTIRSPQGREVKINEQRGMTLADADDPLSMLSYTESMTKNGSTTTVQYDLVQRKVTQTTAENRQVVFHLDEFGRTIKKEFPAQSLAPVEYVYNAQGRVSSIIQGQYSLDYAYNSALQLVSMTDNTGRQVKYVYDAFGDIVEVEWPDGRKTTMTRDASGNTTAFAMPSGTQHKMGYNAEGHMTTFVAAGGTAPIEQIFNLNGELTETIYPSGSLVANTFDSLGRMATSNDSLINRTFTYADDTNRLKQMSAASAASGLPAQSLEFSYDGSDVTRTIWQGAANGTFDYTYDALSNVTAIDFSIPGNGFTSHTALIWDKEDRITNYGSQVFHYNGPGGMLSSVEDNGSTTAYAYDEYGRLTERRLTVSGQLQYEVKLQYDATGKVKQKTETTAQGAATYLYDYDVNGQLTEVRLGNTVTASYSYAANGNRLSHAENGAAEEWAAYDQQDRLTSRAGIDYVYNEDGFMTRRGDDTFTYSARGTLEKVDVGGEVTTYAYDALGRRVARTDASGTTQYLYGIPESVMILTASVDPTGVVTEYYYDRAGMLTGMKRNGELYPIAVDNVGTPKVITDSSGQVVKELSYDSFGVQLSDSNPAFELIFGYAGGLEDEATGLVRFGLRDYEPESGRWTARDPILLQGGQANLYVYVGNDPIQYRDPLGLFCIGATAYAGVGGGVKFCMAFGGASLCSELGFGAGGSFDLSLFEKFQETDNFGFDATISASYGPGKLTTGFKGNYDIGNACAKTGGAFKLSLGPVELDFLDLPGSTFGQGMPEIKEKKDPLTLFKEAWDDQKKLNKENGGVTIGITAAAKGYTCARLY